MQRVSLLAFTLVFALACGDAPVASTELSGRQLQNQIDQERRGGRPIPNEWVIQFREGAPNVRGLMEGLLRAHGGTAKSEHLDIAGAFVARMPEAAANAIRSNPFVRSVTPNVTLTMSTTQSNATWGLRRIDQRNLPIDGLFSYPADGNGTHLYFIDTGLDPQHEEFGTRATSDVSTVGDNIGTIEGCAHGTQVAGVAAGVTLGVAKRARIHSVKVMDRYCYGDVSSYLYGIEWIRANHVKPAVVNASVVFDVIVPAVDSAVSNLMATTGVSFVVAAGNDGIHSCYASPARVPEVLTVAATDSSDTRTGWSAIGSCVDLYAPGMDIITAWYDYDAFPNDHNDWAITLGTSVAAPFVTGVAAGYLQRNPNASPAAVHAHIVNSATVGAVQYPGIDTPNRLLYQAPASTMTISLAGPASVRPSTVCGWEATPSGGAGPYLYSWYKNGALQQQGSNALYTTSLTSVATISVTVQDNYGASASVSRNVTVSTAAKVCRY